MADVRENGAHPQNSTMVRLHKLSYVFLVICVANLSGYIKAVDDERKLYIVYMGGLPKREEYSPSTHHASILQEVIGGSFVEKSLIRSYGRSFNAFAANLTEKERQKLAAHDEVVSIFPSRTLQLHTTESWDFTGFPLNVSRNLKIERDIIIGVIDTGIWPESESFSDRGLGPPPKKWKGVCKGGHNFTCNNKIIGARHYDIDESARDLAGHGSHTASTAAGDIVKKANFYKLAEGTARGGVPSARIAVYKVCSNSGCKAQDILAAFDDAIADGVDLLTVSLGAEFALPLQGDVISIGSFHASENGILTVNSAGNDGFDAGSTASVAPWLFSIAASTTKRRIINQVVLGNGRILTGNTINSFKLNGIEFPLVYGKDASKTCDNAIANTCSEECLDEGLVKGKIVLCNFDSSVINEVNRAGALGGIFHSGDSYDTSFVVPSAASVLSYERFNLVQAYYNSTKRPTANIFPSHIIENKVAPVIASFSSRGPNVLFPDVLKPDITAPGVDILAAFSPEASPSDYDSDKRSVKYNILSGTSMSCPHVAGVAAYVKSYHPDWSPSAIKSAIMTTAWPLNATNTIHGDAEFSYGAGHINPLKALSPGLVYETEKVDYVKFLCSLKLDNSTLGKIFGDNTTTCPKVVTSTPRDLNYPTLAAQAHKNKGIIAKFTRTVTNVGLANSTYKAIITKRAPEISVTVKPSTLSFKSLKERKSFVVTATVGKVDKILSASLVWSDGVHTVRSPIVVYPRTS